MARTKLFKQLKKNLNLAYFAKARGMSVDQVKELVEKNEIDKSRRAFLKAAGMATIAASPVLNALMSPKAYGQALASAKPVWIVGGGAAGLAAAYQLQRAGVKFVLIEGSGRLGGRIHTGENFNADGQFVEIGAELVDTNHYTLRGLAEALKVEIEDFGDYDKDVSPALYSFDGKTHTEEDLLKNVDGLLKAIKAANDELYEGDKDASIDALHAEKLPNLKKYDTMSLEQFLDKNASTAPKWVIQAIKVAYVCEYGTDAGELPSIALIDLIDTDISDDRLDMFGDSDESKRVKGGNEKLIKAIIAKLGLRIGVGKNDNCALNARLLRVQEKSNSLTVTATVGGRTLEQDVEKLIVTIPLTVLREVEGFKPGSKLLSLPPLQMKAIQELGYGKNTKTFVGFKSRFWRDKNKTPHAASSGSIYSSAQSQSFWETSRLQAGERGIITNFSGGSRAVYSAEKGSAGIVDELLRDLSLTYGAELVKREYEFGVHKMMAWPKHPFVKASYSSPKLGQYGTLWGHQRAAGLDNRIFFAGEHTHPLTFGFMNGGYSSGIRAANEVIASLLGIEVEAEAIAKAIEENKIPAVPGRHLIPADKVEDEGEN